MDDQSGVFLHEFTHVDTLAGLDIGDGNETESDCYTW